MTHESDTNAEFWYRKWAQNEIAFHEGQPNALLVKHLAALSLEPRARVFVPLCGKTRDIAWLLSRGYRVVGAELSPLAIGQLFAELGLDPVRETAGLLTRHAAADLEVFEGDLFALTADLLGPVDAIFDRAALVALPAAVRPKYATALVEMTAGAPQVVITFEYDQTLMAGPPFSVTGEELHRLYGEACTLTWLETVAVEGGLKGVPATETVWRLQARDRAD